MVDPHKVDQLELSLDAADPPFVSGLLMLRPVVERIPPQLSGCREIIRRNSRDFKRIPLRIKPEQLLVCPDIAVVDRHEDGDVSDDEDVALGRILAQRHPLLLEQELRKLIETDLLLQLFGVGLL